MCAAERIAARPCELNANRRGKPQVLLHALAHDDLVGVVMAKRKFVVAVSDLRI